MTKFQSLYAFAIHMAGLIGLIVLVAIKAVPETVGVPLIAATIGVGVGVSVKSTPGG
jgi:hypothetical protein